MLANRSIPRATVIPVLAYPNLTEAIEWLCDRFGFSLRLRIGNHRAQLNVGDGAIVVTERTGSGVSAHRFSVMVRVDDVDGHWKHATSQGAHVTELPTDHPYGERQYCVEDLAGYPWTFSQSIADVDPASWGGESGELSAGRKSYQS